MTYWVRTLAMHAGDPAVAHVQTGTHTHTQRHK